MSCPAAAAAAARTACEDGYGLVIPHSSRSAPSAVHQHDHTAPSSFYCEQCPNGTVPLLPGSNLELRMDGTACGCPLVPGADWDCLGDGGYGTPGNWSIHLVEASRGGSDAASALPAAAAAAAGDGAPLHRPAAVASSQGWHARPPYGYSAKDAVPYPGQCVACPEGSKAEGNACEWLYALVCFCTAVLVSYPVAAASA